MDIDQDTQEQDTPPPGSSFAEAYTKATGKDASSVVPPAYVQAGNFNTPLYIYPPKTCHTDHTTAYIVAA
jgi:hypothetical protein